MNPGDKKKVLVTGASGFAGSHLTTYLRALGHEVIATSTRNIKGHVTMNLNHRHIVDKIVAAELPDVVMHLGAQSSAGRSWQDPSSTYSTNVTGTHDLLESVHKHCPEATVLVSATSDEYGPASEYEMPINEETPLRPLSPYAASKVASEAVANLFHEAFGLRILVTRAFMHIGPGQPNTFATADWSHQIAQVELGQRDPQVATGNISLVREFGDVRDVVRAYWDIACNGKSGEAYNVATGEGHSLREVLEKLIELSPVDRISIMEDPSKIRPADPRFLVGDNEKLRNLSGWTPEYSLDTTLQDVLDFWRRHVRGTAGQENITRR